MAEAVVHGAPRSRFFCHKCSIEIDILLPGYKCPRCTCGFIEELEPGRNDGGTGMDVSSEDSSDIEVDIPGFNIPQQDLLGMMLGFSSPEQISTTTNRSNARGNRRRMDAWYRYPQAPRRSDSSRGRQEMLPLSIENIIQDFMLNQPGAGPNRLVSQDGQPPVMKSESENEVTEPYEYVSFSSSLRLFLGNPGDYVWGRDGLDAIVTQLLNQMDGTGPPPLPRKQIDEIPTTTITQSQVDCKLQCSVCWEDFKLSEPVRQLPCQHLYHAPCIIPWLELHGTCPICRQSLGDQNSAEANQDIVGPSLAALFRAANESNNSRTSSTSSDSSSSSNFTTEFCD